MKRLGMLAAALLAVAIPCDGSKPFQAGALPTPVNLAGATVVGDYLHLVGGDTTEGFATKTWTGSIRPDRTVDGWRENRPLPYKLIYLGNSMLQAAGVLYVCGGQKVEDIPGAIEYKKEQHRFVLMSRSAPDGSFSEWQRSSEWQDAGSVGAAAVTDGRFIYMLGGDSSQSTTTPGVSYAPILTDGSLGPWTKGRDLPMPQWFQSAYFHNGSIYSVGGRTGQGEDTVTDKVFASVVAADGSLGVWTEVAEKLAYPVNGASACAADDFLFLFCGRTNGGSLVERVQFSKLTNTGISNWVGLDTVIDTRYYSTAALDPIRRSIYLVGGRRSTHYLDIVPNVYCYPLVQKQTVAAQVATVGGVTMVPWAQAEPQAKAESKRVLLIAFSSAIDFSKTAVNTLASSGALAKLPPNTMVATVDVAENRDAAKRLQILRVPSYFVVGADGKVEKQLNGLKKPEEVAALFQ